MKSQYMLRNISCIFVIFMIFSCVDSPKRQSIYGIWIGEHKGKELRFEFKKNQTCKLSFKDRQSDSVELLNGDFEIDYSKKPIPLSIKNIPQINYPLHTIIEFKKGDEIRIAGFAKRWRLRPISFDSETSMILKYDKEARQSNISLSIKSRRRV